MKNNLETLAEYGNRVVDLTRRNRLLKFPKNSKSILFDVNLQEFLTRFGSLDELQIEFNHRQILDQDQNLSSSIMPEKAPQNIKDLDTPPTNIVGEKLITVLNALRLETKRKFEEHGLHTLFLAIGKVRWKESSIGSKKSSNVVNDYDFNAPLLLVPIRIEEKKSPKRTVVSAYLETDDIIANKVLGLLLEKEYKSRPLELVYDGEGNWFDAYQNLCSQVKEIFAELHLDYEIIDEIQIGQYSFFGQQIYADLNNNEESILQHEFINALCSHSPIQQENLVIKTDNPDALLTSENDYNVMDADRSQLKVLQNVINGNHLNVQGPPGTGKSQTIVNVISNLLARGKTILMVCEKQIALEVVLDRLKTTGLDKLCLPLFHYNADKKTFAKSILDDRDSIIRMEENSRAMGNLDTSLENREKKIAELRSYAAVLAEVVQPLDKSLHWVHGEWAKHAEVTSDDKVPWMGNDPLQMDYDEYHKIMCLLDNITPVINCRAEEGLNHWKNIRRQYFSPDFVNRINKVLEDIGKKILSISNMDSNNIKFSSVHDIRKLIALQDAIGSTQSTLESFTAESDLAETVTKLTDAIYHIEQYQLADQAYSEKYNIPFHWDSGLIQAIDNDIDDATKISSVKAAAADSQLFKDRMDFIAKTCGVLPFRDFTIDELLIYKNILLIDPVIENIKHWSDRDVLQNISEKLNVLNVMNNQRNKAKNILDKWGIIIDGIEPSIALAITTRFDNNYGSFLRYFYSSYRRDCNALSDWCNAELPQKYTEYAEIVGAIKDYLRLEGKIENLLTVFNENYAASGRAIKARQISVLSQSVNKTLEVLFNSEKDYIPEKIMHIYHLKTEQPIEIFYAIIQDIYKILNSSWNIFKTKANGAMSLGDLMHLHPLLQQSVENKLKLYEAVSIACKEKISDCSFGELKRSAREVDDLFSQFEKIQQIQLENLFKSTNNIESIINNSQEIKDFLFNIQKFTSVIAKNSKGFDGFTVQKATEYIINLHKTLPSLNQWISSYSNLETELNRLFENEKSVDFIEELSFADAVGVINEMVDDQPGLQKWMQYMRYTHQLEQLGHAWFFEAIKNKTITHPSAVFAQALWSAWLEAYYAQQPILQNFNLKDHKRIISEFKTLEQQVLKTNALRIVSKYAPMFNFSKRYSGEKDKLLVRQSQLKMRHQSIRKVVRETNKLLLEYKPCWMMSPLTLSSYIPYGSLNFDVIIFDEASQLRVEHSLAAIARAKQVIIFGDENQLPPTSFFENSSDAENGDEDIVDNYESILHATKEILPGANGLLSHHYRSKYEELIAFSNHYIYRDELVTFPNPNKLHKAVQFEYVDDGLFDGGKGGSRRNDIEAKRVVEMCLKQVTEEPNKSLGVIAFSRAQEVAIRDALLDSLKDKPEFQPRLDETSDLHEQFFIKNLESVQGDERDTIILSVGYGKDKRTGEVYNRFGPINGRYGHRRLNVAITRAKEKVICVSSIKSSDIRNSENSKGAFILQKYLEYAERGIESLDASLLVQGQSNVPADSPFEEEVERALKLRGYIVHRQIGASGFKIDLAIVNPKNDQEYILGIECDGATYHSSYSARMNDRIRQEILERLGWKIYRIWSQHWIHNKEDIVEDIIRTIAHD